MHDDMEQLISTYSNTEDVLIASVQCQKQDSSAGTGSDLCDRLMNKCTSEPGFPTLCYGDYSSGDKYTEYTGSHSYSAMLKFVQSNLGPAADAVSAEVSEPAPPKKCVSSESVV